eukprot:687589-Pyramimonas_sp.AAC.1
MRGAAEGDRQRGLQPTGSSHRRPTPLAQNPTAACATRAPNADFQQSTTHNSTAQCRRWKLDESTNGSPEPH